ncbi:MAG TPA: type IV toxin-antitoxin system AbiEi family antitoxin [Phycisphaerae bacterium]|nr:type IV toxin-antitoxin system AbiEi family antitoxin [Phycisphaerae bacterium]HRY67859.1 type IV toxin-antitoxin system AbiEi family antitoxin [Phycisphaerae bacterium]HSA25312.1 type IV toxin-antitoxin system AbiEi family antitoxin [Phycisphaerae bacterium]
MTMLTETAILRELCQRSDILPPLRIDVVERAASNEGPDAVLQISWSGRSWRFVAEFKRLSTPRLFQDAMGQARRYGEKLGLRPLVVMPYLSAKQLDTLAAEGMSGFDLSGNGIIQVSGELLVYRKGEPNAYPASMPIRKVYQGASSMVARVFLARPGYDSVSDVRAEIERRGGNVSLSTVSKVLSALEDELIIRREGRSSRLIQAEELLDKLAENYTRPRATRVEQFSWRVRDTDIDRQVCAAGKQARVQVTVTGGASVNQYAVMAREKTMRFYCSDLSALTGILGGRMEPTQRFADVELFETEEPQVYFDRREESGVAFASPVQCWLELQAGDKREQEAAQQVKERILNALASAGRGETR